MKVEGLILGSRKCATTWVYQNYLDTDDIVVSEKVKESGYFAGNNRLNLDSYHNLFPQEVKKGAPYIEIDTSLLTSENSAQNIFDYNPDMKVAVILRDPIGFFKSRLTHSIRKGEIIVKEGDTPETIIAEYKWFANELDYNSISEFEKTFGQNFKLFKYENIKIEPLKFYSSITDFLTSNKIKDAVPTNLGIVNKARVSKMPFVTLLYTRGAKLFRSWGLDGVVQFFRDSKFRSMIETDTKEDDFPFKDEVIAECLHKHFSHSFSIHQNIN